MGVFSHRLERRSLSGHLAPVHTRTRHLHRWQNDLALRRIVQLEQNAYLIPTTLLNTYIYTASCTSSVNKCSSWILKACHHSARANKFREFMALQLAPFIEIRQQDCTFTSITDGQRVAIGPKTEKKREERCYRPPKLKRGGIHLVQEGNRPRTWRGDKRKIRKAKASLFPERLA